MLELSTVDLEYPALKQPTTNITKTSENDLQKTQGRYNAERQKRLRPEGPVQYFGGLLSAVRLLQSGFLYTTEILFVDTTGGFGGMRWWDKYPGLACDVESYTYMPLLEETKYMHKSMPPGLSWENTRIALLVNGIPLSGLCSTPR
ncbi:hypothetical protein PENVUL_c030G09146 [Penicillium vulpinum]|uniref:Uncharacterized protein n=2 Tax=Penicillium vulpinum TaxID=29845 RepID=A0A1V6RSN8_9EURO|nr:hypothetical protein PENVUL_c030G09146 [Penicillium vulpinum]